MGDCPRLAANLKGCTCTYGCSKKGRCCECLSYHRSMGEFPACFFTREGERTYDRSFESLRRHRA
jgi:hypothetical protein